MSYDSDKHHRRSIRLAGYDYASEGAYFIAICTHSRGPWFGIVQHGTMHLNACGRIVAGCWHDLPNHYTRVSLDTFVVMPDHVHGVVMLSNDINTTAPSGSAPTTSCKRRGLPEIVRAFKSFSARRVNQLRGTTGVAVWQRNYYDHIIRDEQDLHAIRDYVVGNPARWAETQQ